MFQTTLTKRAVWLADDVTQKAFLVSLDPSSKYLTDVPGLDRGLGSGRPSRDDDRRDRRRAARLKFKHLTFTWLFCLDRENDETTKRRNEETIRRRNLLQMVHVSTRPSFGDRSGP